MIYKMNKKQYDHLRKTMRHDEIVAYMNTEMNLPNNMQEPINIQHNNGNDLTVNFNEIKNLITDVIY